MPLRLVVKSGLKTMSMFCGSIPSPVSSIVTRTLPESLRDEHTRSLRRFIDCIASIAFVTRLRTTCWSWTLFPSTSGSLLSSCVSVSMPCLRRLIWRIVKTDRIRLLILTGSLRSSPLLKIAVTPVTTSFARWMEVIIWPSALSASLTFNLLAASQLRAA